MIQEGDISIDVTSNLDVVSTCSLLCMLVSLITQFSWSLPFSLTESMIWGAALLKWSLKPFTQF